MRPHDLERLKEELGRGDLNRLPPWDKKILDGWLDFFEDDMDLLIETISKFNNWFHAETGEWPKTLKIYQKSINKAFMRKAKQEGAQDPNIMIRELARSMSV